MKHAAVWIDGEEARIFHFGPRTFDDPIVHAVILSAGAPARSHRLSGAGDVHCATEVPEGRPYYHAVAEALADAGDVLLLGPSREKHALLRHVQRHDPKLAARIIGLETVDHPTDEQIAALMRRYIQAARGARLELQAGPSGRLAFPL